MTEPVLKQVIKLLSLFIQFAQQKFDENAIQKIESYINKHIKGNLSKQYIEMLNFYMSQTTDFGVANAKKKLSRIAVKAIGLINNINTELSLIDKYSLIILFFELVRNKKQIHASEYDFIETIAISFNVDEHDFYNLKSFILKSYGEIPYRENIIIINSDQQEADSDVKHIFRENLNGFICILYIKQINYYLFYYKGDDILFINERQIEKESIYTFKKGDSISSYKMGYQNLKLKPIYYTEIGMSYHDNPDFKKISLDLDEIEFHYSGSTEGVQKFSFSTESYLMLGIMGASGSGKTTLINILNGNLKPKSGKVFINGIDLYHKKNKATLKKLIGYVPQDDLLLENLSVYQNLYFNAKLCLADKTETEINEVVNKILIDLDLFHIKGLKVGSETNQIISGGQRKRLNIGIELLREPPILLVDEPTSGLSSRDSAKIINILREQTLKGKLVILVLHQPSSNIFKLLDQLIVMDKGGYVTYAGDPLDSVVYFKTINEQIAPEEKECPSCGNINPDIIFEIIEDKAFNNDGENLNKRKIEPSEWYRLYTEKIDKKLEKRNKQNSLPEVNFTIPKRFKQFLIFSKRNLLSKLANTQYLLISLLEAPLLAIILAYFSKYNSGSEQNVHQYIFSTNDNIPAYILMSIIVSLFIGMLISAEEIFNDKRILIREKFLNLSRLSYINSKVFFLLILSAIQTLSYVIIGNLILEIQGMNFIYWIILFSVTCFANLLGLNISSGLKSVISIYILIPFLIIPQILLSGSIIKFDKLNSKLSSKIAPPLVADLMPARWAFEALSVAQFRYNDFEKYYFEIEKQEGDVSYKLNYVLPELQHVYNEYKELLSETDELNRATNEKMDILIHNLYLNFGVNKKLVANKDIDIILQSLRMRYSEKLDQLLYKKDSITNFLINKCGSVHKYNEFKQKNYNKSIAQLVLNKERTDKYVYIHNNIIRTYEPVFASPTNRFGRSLFFSSQKRFLNKHINTFYFNLLAIWILNLVLYFALIKNILFIVLNKIHLFRFVKSKE